MPNAGFVQGLVQDTEGTTAPTRLPMAPIATAAFCLKPHGLMTAEHVERLSPLKCATPSFTIMRGLAMRFHAILRSRDPAQLDPWMDDAHRSGLYRLRRFVLILRRDIDAVRNAVSETWSSGQTEGQINRLKRLKRAMYGRAKTDHIRARMLPFVSN